MLAVGGCIGTTPEDRARDSLPPYYDGDQFHRPGQPCILCHNGGLTGEGEFMVAGTVYPMANSNSEAGMGGVVVEVTDAEGNVVRVTSNRKGNFYFEQGGGLREGVGQTRVPYQLVYPLQVRLLYGDLIKVMKGVTWREGSCAHCHTLQGPNEASEPPVYLMDPP